MSRYIDADALEKRLQDFVDWCRDARRDGVDFVLKCPLPDMPTADVELVRHGHWDWHGFNIFCSECDFEPFFDSTEPLYNYCPNCGAKMDGKEADG